MWCEGCSASEPLSEESDLPTCSTLAQRQRHLGQKTLDSVLEGGEKAAAWLGRSDAPDLERGEAIRGQGAVLRQLHAWLKEKDPGFGGLVRVQNKRHEFLWVHPQFEEEY